MHTRHRPSTSKRILWICVGSALLILVLFFLRKPAPEKPPRAPRLHSLPEIGHLITSVDTFKDRASNLHELRKALSLPENIQETNEIIERCSQLTQHQQLLDTECTAVWLNALRESKIVGVERLWGFEDTHFGAITLRLENGIRAMFKPCSSKSEDTTKEVIASYLDQLLQFGQTAPVITRIIPLEVLENLVWTVDDIRVLNYTKNKCGREGYFIGPMIGWWENLIPVRTVRKYKQPVEEVIALREPYADNLLTTQLQARFHTFYLLVNILRHGKDEFITKDGDLVSLDLDRSRFQSTLPITGPEVNYTWCYVCYMDKWVYNTFQAVGPKQTPENRLGNLMKTMLSYEDIFDHLWDSRLAEALDTRVSMLLECVDECIYTYGANNVLLDEKPDMSPKELVTWFVTHSEYKNMNGKQGPSNLDFLDELQE